MRRWDQLLDERNSSLKYRLLRFILCVFSLLYGIGIRSRLIAYRIGLLRRYDLPTRVVSVGNITVGGTGKTPVALYIAGRLHDQGKQVVVLSRGYGRKAIEAPVGLISDGEHRGMSPQSAGDEPYLFTQKQPGIPVMVGKNRVLVGLEAIARFTPDVLLLDDGFQHIRLQRDLDILLVDASDPFGNGHLLPRGPLREPLDSMQRANVLWLTRVDQCPDLPATRNRLRVLCPDVPMVETIHRPKRLTEWHRGRERNIEDLKDRDVVALSGIGNPKAFEQTLVHLGAAIHPLRFPDHHPYTSENIQFIFRFAQDIRAWAVVTTEKDAVRWPDMGESPIPVLVLEIEIEVIHGENQLSMLLT